MINSKIDIKYAALIICFYILIFQNLLQEHIVFFQYFDELLALLSLPIIFFKTIKNGIIRIKRNSYDNLIVIFIFLLLAIGLISNFLYDIQPLNIYLGDVLLMLKFFLVYFLSRNILNWEFIERHKKNILFHLNFIIFVLLSSTILNYAFNIWPFAERYGIMANKLFYSHPTALAAICAFLYSCVIAIRRKTKTIQGGIILLILVSTLRIKAIGFAIICVLLTLYIEKSNKKLSITKVGLIGALGGIFAYDQIVYYFFQNDEFARAALTKKAFDVANDFFPFGGGFGTYGSYLSGESYSSLYYKYNLSNVWGLQIGNAWFISDTFWPMIIGQFGYVGFVCYIVILINLFKSIQKEYSHENKYIYSAKIFSFLYLLISSVAESAFVNPMAIPLGLLIGIRIREEGN